MQACGGVNLMMLSRQVMVFGAGQTETAVRQSDVWIWQMVSFETKRLCRLSELGLRNAAVFPQEGSSQVTMNEQEFRLSAGDSILVPEQTQ